MSSDAKPCYALSHMVWYFAGKDQNMFIAHRPSGLTKSER